MIKNKKGNITWLKNYNKFKVFSSTFKNKRVGSCVFDDPELSLWVAEQRILKERGLLDKKREEALDRVNFNFTQKEKTDSELLYTMSATRKINEKEKTTENEKNALLWLKSVRSDVLSGKLFTGYDDDERYIELLIKNKFLTKKEVWEARQEEKWNEKREFIEYLMFDEGVRIVESQNPQEYRWIAKQNELIKSGRISSKRRDLVQPILSVWQKIVDEEKVVFAEKRALRLEAEAKGLSRYEYKPCIRCGGTTYSKKGECVICVGVRDSKSRQKRKEENPEYYAAMENKHSASRKAMKLNATPKMSRERMEMINDIYIRAAEQTSELGEPHEVDHIIALVGKDYIEVDGEMRYTHVVCGLHVPENMQVITKKENVSKSSRVFLDEINGLENEKLKGGLKNLESKSKDAKFHGAMRGI